MNKKKFYLWLLSIIAIIAVFIYAQDVPSSYTTHYRFRLWSEGSNPSADSLNQNWEDIDSVIYAVSNPDMAHVVYDNSTSTISAIKTYGSGGGIIFNSSGNNALNVPFFSNLNSVSTIPGELARNTSGDIRLFFGNSIGTGNWDTVAWKSDIDNIQMSQLSVTGTVGSLLMQTGAGVEKVPQSSYGDGTFSTSGVFTLKDSTRKIHKPFMFSVITLMSSPYISQDYYGNKVIATCDYAQDDTIICNIPFNSFQYSRHLTIDSIHVYAYSNVDGCDLNCYLYSNTNAGAYSQVDAAATVPSSITGAFDFSVSFGYQYGDLPLTFWMYTTAYEATTLYFYNLVVYATAE